jgi:hypothetical protein
MFLENYHRQDAELTMAGGESGAIPYPKISAEDWRVWSRFLPVRSHDLDSKAALSFRSYSFYNDIPAEVATEVRRAGQYFDRVEIWRKREVDKDPIAVGVLGNDRYMIARWGMEKLIPFESIKNSTALVLAWRYATSPWYVFGTFAGVGLLAWILT